jgi:hypothetical protein
MGSADGAAGEGAVTVLRAIWAAEGQTAADLDDDAGRTKICRNMREVTFEGFGESDDDPAAAWRAMLARDGKVRPGAGSVADLVLGGNAAAADQAD